MLTLPVCSLPYAALDLEIEAAVTRVFEQFGTVFVKIRRERVNGNLPYAFAQYIVSLARFPLQHILDMAVS